MRLSRILRVSFNRVFRRKVVEAELVNASFRDGTFDLTMKHPGVAIIAKAVGQYYLESGAPNFLEMKMFDPETMKLMVLTIRPVSRPTPYEITRRLRDVIALYRAGDASADIVAAKVMGELGYDDLRADDRDDTSGQQSYSEEAGR